MGFCSEDREGPVGVQSLGERLSGPTSGRGNSLIKGRELKDRRKHGGSGAVLVTEYKVLVAAADKDLNSKSKCMAFGNILLRSGGGGGGL